MWFWTRGFIMGPPQVSHHNAGRPDLYVTRSKRALKSIKKIKKKSKFDPALQRDMHDDVLKKKKKVKDRPRSGAKIRKSTKKENFLWVNVQMGKKLLYVQIISGISLTISECTVKLEKKRCSWEWTCHQRGCCWNDACGCTFGVLPSPPGAREENIGIKRHLRTFDFYLFIYFFVKRWNIHPHKKKKRNTTQSRFRQTLCIFLQPKDVKYRNI